MLNKTILMGRLTHDPDLRHTQTDTPVCNFSIACTRNFKNADGEHDTDFFDCVAWRGTAEFINEHFKKGSMAIVEGQLQNRNWVDDAGNSHRRIVLIVNNIFFGSSKPKSVASADESSTKDVEKLGSGTDFEDPGDGELPF